MATVPLWLSAVVNRLQVLNAAGRLSDAAATELTRVAGEAFADNASDLGVDGVDLVVCEYPGVAIHELGVGGYTPSAALVFVSIEPRRLDEVLARGDALAATIAHELHHAKRWAGPGYGDRLIDSVVSEGLATVYEIERYGVVPLYAVSDSDLTSLWERARPVLHEQGHHTEWFFGGPNVPRWAGYAMGVELVRDVLARRGLTARDAAHLPTADFLAASSRAQRRPE